MKKIVMLFLMGTFLVLQYRLWISDSNLVDALRLQKSIAIEKKNIAKLEVRNKVLDKDVQALKLRPETLEDRARSELGMIKKDESFFLVVEPAR